MKKYEFTGETMEFEGHTLRRILYLRNGEHIKENWTGGWIESEDNLSHEGDCCVLAVAKVFGNAKIRDNAVVANNAIVKDNVQIKENAMVFGAGIVGADTIVTGRSSISGKSEVFFYADENYGQPNISGETIISSSVIEATGSVLGCILENKKLFGFLNMSDE